VVERKEKKSLDQHNIFRPIPHSHTIPHATTARNVLSEFWFWVLRKRVTIHPMESDPAPRVRVQKAAESFRCSDWKIDTSKRPLKLRVVKVTILFQRSLRDLQIHKLWSVLSSLQQNFGATLLPLPSCRVTLSSFDSMFAHLPKCVSRVDLIGHIHMKGLCRRT
jgi:hypothetical protein